VWPPKPGQGLTVSPGDHPARPERYERSALTNAPLPSLVPGEPGLAIRVMRSRIFSGQGRGRTTNLGVTGATHTHSNARRERPRSWGNVRSGPFPRRRIPNWCRRAVGAAESMETCRPMISIAPADANLSITRHRRPAHCHFRDRLGGQRRRRCKSPPHKILRPFRDRQQSNPAPASRYWGSGRETSPRVQLARMRPGSLTATETIPATPACAGVAPASQSNCGWFGTGGLDADQ
jgi:hypothetical protein